MNRSDKIDSRSRISYSLQCGTQTDLTHVPGYFSQDHVALPSDLFKQMARSHYSQRFQYRTIAVMTDHTMSINNFCFLEYLH